MRPHAFIFALLVLGGCGDPNEATVPTLRWYVAKEASGAFETAALRCADGSHGAYQIKLVLLPADADQQREQLVRRLAARDPDIDIIAMDVIWTAEFAQAGWILPWRDANAVEAREGRLAAPLESAVYRSELWGAPFNTNAQLLWYRTDRVSAPPKTWDEMIDAAEALGDKGIIQAQGERYEGLTVFFVSLLASAGGAVLTEAGEVSLESEPTRRAVGIMKRLGNSTAADPALASNREDQARLGFERGDSAFMVNYTFVWESAQRNAPEVAARMGWARWPAVVTDRPSRVTVGGLNLGISAHSRHPQLAFQAATCIASKSNQRLAAVRAALPPTIDSLYDDPTVKKALPFAELLRATLRDAVQRPETPTYNEISLAISRTLHPLRDIQIEADAAALRKLVERALRSEGLL